MSTRRGTSFAILVAASAAAGCGSGGGDAGDSGGAIDAGPDTPGACDLGPWDGKDLLLPSQLPPCDLAPADVPLFVAIGWDDNGDAEGMTWALDMLKARGAHATFFMTSVYGQSPAVVATWKRAAAEGHEIGNHTVSHLPEHGGRSFTLAQWNDEIGPCNDFLTGSADVVEPAALVGFRTPYLEYNDATLTAVEEHGFWYDCSIEEGYEPGHDGSNLYWPYTLDQRSPGHTTQVEWMDPERPIQEIEPHPGLWELPVYAFFTPPDDKCAEYGLAPGFRDRLKERQSWFDPASGAITGFDYNLWGSVAIGGFAMSKDELLATLKYSFDQRLGGNRAPFLIGTHTAYYVDAWSANASGTPLAADRRQAVEDFLDYALERGARVTSYAGVLAWMRNPKPR